MTERLLVRTLEARATSDGAGVRLRRSLGAAGPDSRLDPFLLLDEFFSADPDDYLAGFPNHPHRGFETITCMLDGRMAHEDHLGNRGLLGPGDVQWMTAGRGIVHSEMPRQQAGRMRGFQLWLNLPAREKMQPPVYRDIPADAIPEHRFDSGATLRLIAGCLELEDGPLRGPVNADRARTTDPLIADLRLPAGAALTLPIPPGHNAALYVFDGALGIGGSAPLAASRAAILGDGARVALHAAGDGAGALLIAGRPLDEPIVQYGPFVMNTREEIEQALADFRDGTLTAG